MNEEINDVLIIGGGDVGLITALCLRRVRPDTAIRVVDDLDSPSPRVGKSTFRPIMNVLHDFLQIEESEFIREVRPVWKASVYFRDWAERPPFHFPFDTPKGYPKNDVSNRYRQLEALQARPEYVSTPGQEIAEQRRTPWDYRPEKGELVRYRDVAYHLPTERFEDFLRVSCENEGVHLINDRVTHVAVEDTRVTSVECSKSSHRADLYIDASGFNRVIRSECDHGDFNAFEFPLDRAVRYSVERPLEQIIPATVVESDPYGWFWTIDTFDERDRGYVYSSEHIEDSAAEDRLRKRGGLEGMGSDADLYRFESGFYDTPWMKNHLTIGNACGFIEPLQSTALTTNAVFAMFLARLLNTVGFRMNQHVRETYNRYVRALWNNVYSFISIHYKFNQVDAPMWEEMRSLTLPPLARRFYRWYERFGLAYYESPNFGFMIDDNGIQQQASPFDKESFFHMFLHLGVKSNGFDGCSTHSAEVEEHLVGKAEQITERIAGFHRYDEYYYGELMI